MCGYNVARRKTGARWEIKHVGTVTQVNKKATDFLHISYLNYLVILEKIFEFCVAFNVILIV